MHGCNLMNKNLIDKHIRCSIEYADEINLLVASLFKKSLVKYFSYNRYYRNKKWIGLYTDVEPVQKALATDLGPIFLGENGVIIESGVYFHHDLKDIVKTKVSGETVDSFFMQENNPRGKLVVENGLLIIRQGQAYDESFYFSLLDINASMSRAYYYQVLNMIKSFCLYFLHHAKKLIAEAEKNVIPYAVPQGSAHDFLKAFFCHESAVSDKDWFNNRSFCFATPFGDAFLSKQELNCLRLLANNYSYVQIAEELQLQYKTVESYIQNVKNKLSANTKIELTRYYNDFSVLDFAGDESFTG